MSSYIDTRCDGYDVHNPVPTRRLPVMLDELDRAADYWCPAARRGGVLDVGGTSLVGKTIERRYGVTLSYQDIDLDRQRIEGKWPVIFCCEVLEHVGNPLFLLESMRKALNPSGIIVFSMPLVISRLRPHGFRGKHHLFEMDNTQFMHLLEEAGLMVEWRREYLIREWWRYLLGPRPLVRLFTDRGLFAVLRAT